MDVPQRDIRNVGLSAVSGGQQVAVGGRKCHAEDPTLAAGRQDPYESPRGGVPETNTSAVGSGNQLPVRRKTCHPAISAGMFQWLNRHAGIFQIPDPDRFVSAATDK